MLCGIEYTDPNMHPRLPSSCCARSQSKHKVAEANGTCCHGPAAPVVAQGSQKRCIAAQQAPHGNNLPFRSIFQGIQLHISSQ